MLAFLDFRLNGKSQVLEAVEIYPIGREQKDRKPHFHSNLIPKKFRATNQN
jgi:hypothetical protein